MNNEASCESLLHTLQLESVAVSPVMHTYVWPVCLLFPIPRHPVPPIGSMLTTIWMCPSQSNSGIQNVNILPDPVPAIQIMSMSHLNNAITTLICHRQGDIPNLSSVLRRISRTMAHSKVAIFGSVFMRSKSICSCNSIAR